MSRHQSFVCEACCQDFTRRSSANRHNLNIHSGRGIIVRALEYIVRSQISSNGLSKNKLKGHKLLVCATCSQDFTRKSSAKRHNNNIHLGMGIIVRFSDYVVGRLQGKYVASDPLLFRKNDGNNIRARISSVSSLTHSPSQMSFGDSITGNEVNQKLPLQQPKTQVKNTSHDFSDLDYIINLASRVKKIKNLLSISHSSMGMPPANSSAFCNIPFGVDVNTLLAQLDNEYFFGYKEEICSCCIYDAIYRLDFRDGSIDKRIWSPSHKCDPQRFASYEKNSRGREYVEACDLMPSNLLSIVKHWLKDNPHVFATKLPYLPDRQRGLIEITSPNNPAESICIPFFNEDPPTKLTDNPEYWIARAVANENKPTPLNGQVELLDFLENVSGSTFGVFKVCSRVLVGYNCEYYLIYLGKEVATVKVHTDG